jgi:hypothetical protein
MEFPMTKLPASVAVIVSVLAASAAVPSRFVLELILARSPA